MKVTVVSGEVEGSLSTPCSKSYAQRAFAAALLAEGRSTIRGLELCDDTRSAIEAITALGAKVEWVDEHTCTIDGGLSPQSDTINTGESGLSTRLFTPIAALSDKTIRIEGRGSMLRRPIGMMIAPLQELGVEVDCDGFLPITVKGPLRGGETDVDGFVSSQFLTGLLMALPLAEEETVLHINKLNSRPYIAMTIDAVEKFGVRIEHNDYKEFYIPAGQKYEPADYYIEGDWSSASFMLVAAAIAGKVRVKNMSPLSLQADVTIIDVLEDAGAEIITSPTDITVERNELRAFEFDATNSPDLFPILTILASQCEGTSKIIGVGRLLHKESNRAEAIVEEFSKLGIKMSIDDEEDALYVEGGEIIGGTVSSRGDHRIAMSAAVAGLCSREGVTIEDAEAVAKSYPTFWEDLKSLTNNAVRYE